MEKKLFVFILIISIALNNWAFASASSKNKSGFSDEILELIKTDSIRGSELIKTERDTLTFDWNSNDWDNDGIDNNKEISVNKDDKGYFYVFNSNSFIKDSDYDTIPDNKELEYKTSPIRFTFTETDMNNLFFKTLDEAGKLNALNINLLASSLLVDIKAPCKNAIYNFLIESLSDNNDLNELNVLTKYVDEKFSSYYNTIKDVVSFASFFSGLSCLTKVTNQFEQMDNISKIFLDINLWVNNRKLSQYKRLLNRMADDNLFTQSKESVNEVSGNLDEFVSAFCVSIGNTIKDIGISKSVDALITFVPIIGTAKKTFDISKFVVTKTSSLDDAEEKAIECLTYAMIVRAIGEEIKNNCDVVTAKISSTGNNEKLYTIKEARACYVGNLFDDYYRALNHLYKSLDEMKSLTKESSLYKANKTAGNDILKSIEDINSHSILNDINNINHKIRSYSWQYDKLYFEEYDDIMINEWLKNNNMAEIRTNNNNETNSKVQANSQDSFDISNIEKVKLASMYSNDTTVENMDAVTFGSYPQNDKKGKSKEPIEWIVLERKNGKALLFSKYIIDAHKFGGPTWEGSNLRNWLNDEFINNAFDETQQKLIVKSVIKNGGKSNAWDSSGRYIDDGPSTRDKVFCLSSFEANKYFPNQSKRENPFLATTPTKYAKKNGVDTGFYFLRTMNESDSVQAVNGYGVVNFEGYGVSLKSIIGVRPAIWVIYKDQ